MREAASAVEVEEEPREAWKPHAAFGVDCPGIMEWDSRDEVVWGATCNVCGTKTGTQAKLVSPELMAEWCMRRSRLPAQFMDKPFQKTKPSADARTALRAWLDGWDGKPRQWKSEMRRFEARVPVVEPVKAKPPILVGPPGTGKTHLLAQAALLIIREKLIPVGYWSMQQLIEDDQRGGFGGVIDRAIKTPVLILDDIGADPHVTDWKLSKLAEVIDGRYLAGRPLLAATNVQPSQWADQWGERTASRLLGMCDPVRLDDKDWRRK
jgi:DNA replication protein DnaC